MPQKKTDRTPTAITADTGHRTLTAPQVAALLGMGRTSFARLLALGTLPASFPTPLISTPGGSQRTGRRIWLASEIEAWIEGGRGHE